MLCTLKLRVDRPYTEVSAIAVGHRIYSFGGVFSKEDQFIVCVFNTVSLRWTKLPRVPTTGVERRPLEVPCSRYDHTAVLIGDIAYVWGGVDLHEKFCNNELYAFDVDAHRWLTTEVSGSVPEARWGHSACVLRKDMYVHGGVNLQLGECTDDLYKLDTTTMVWTLINPGGTLPHNSVSHTASIIGTKMFVYGGHGDMLNVNNIIRVFDTETNRWLHSPSAQPLPEGRWAHSAFAYNGELYICGGAFHNIIALTRPCDDIWKFSPETLSWKEVKPKVNDSFFIHWGCCCMVGDRVIFGGLKGDKVNDSLYILDLSPSLKTLCKMAVIQYGLDQSLLPHDIRWELAAMPVKKSWRAGELCIVS